MNNPQPFKQIPTFGYYKQFVAGGEMNMGVLYNFMRVLYLLDLYADNGMVYSFNEARWVPSNTTTATPRNPNGV